MIKSYTNQKVILKRKISVNDDNETVFREMTICGRLEFRRKMVRDKKGQELVSEAVLYTEADIQDGDSILHNGRDWPVISIGDKCGLDGKIKYREVRI